MRFQTHSHRQVQPTKNANDWRQVVLRYRNSKLTQREFCKQAGISLNTLNWWLTKARRAKKTAPISFAEIKLPLPTPSLIDRPAAPPWALEVITPNGTAIRWHQAPTTAELALLVRGA